jgi:hypothetical protein
MSIVLLGSSSGSVTLQEPAVAGSTVINLPATSGTMASISSVTANGVLYVNSSSQPTSGSALVFDGTNLGLGVTPSAWLSAIKAVQIGDSGSIGQNSGTIRWGNNFYIDSGGTEKYIRSSSNAHKYIQDANSGHAWYTAGAGTAGNAITFTQAMTLTSAGNFLVGKTSAGTSAAGLTLWGQTDTAGYGRIDFNKTVSGTFTASEYNHNGLPIGTITYSNTATAYNTSSDYRLKNTVAPMTGALAKVALLKPCTYKWNADGSDGEGFIAHELAEVCPHAVTGEKDAVETYTDAEGNEQTRPKYQGIDTSFLVATLTAALQEQQAIIESQSVAIQALTQRITALEGA